jgi:DNA-binding GntR family transcriptional regulator
MALPAELVATKSDYAYLTLRERILTGEYAPGTVLNQATLARTIGISTTPLREALRRLKSEGLVELDAHRDARVTDLTSEEARDLLEVRRGLDPMAVALAADRRSRTDIAEIRTAASGLEPLESGFGVQHLVAHRRFHAALYRASHNELLITTLDGLWDKADRYRRFGLEHSDDPADRDQKRREHQHLADLVVAGDASGAADVMHQHISTSLGAKAAALLGAGNHDARNQPQPEK